jgi:hypothetical protein
VDVDGGALDVVRVYQVSITNGFSRVTTVLLEVWTRDVELLE